MAGSLKKIFTEFVYVSGEIFTCGRPQQISSVKITFLVSCDTSKSIPVSWDGKVLITYSTLVKGCVWYGITQECIWAGIFRQKLGLTSFLKSVTCRVTRASLANYLINSLKLGTHLLTQNHNSNLAALLSLVGKSKRNSVLKSVLAKLWLAWSSLAKTCSTWTKLGSLG